MLCRWQFPVHPAFAMTTNKAQGKMMQCMEVLLDEPVFSHEQLYVTSSQSGDQNSVHKLLMMSMQKCTEVLSK